MNKLVFIVLVLFSLSQIANGQSKLDIVHFLDGPKEVQVKEVGFNTIKYTFPNEETLYSVSKHQVNKIEFASGREEVFQSPFQPVVGLDDFEKVYITYLPEDVAGLEPKGELFSKATGVTTLSSINNVKNRALDKLKAEASMLGANVVFIGNMFQRGNEYGSENDYGSSTQTTFSGTAYATGKLNSETVKGQLEGKAFHHYQTHRLNRNSWSPERILATRYDENRKPILFRFEKIEEREDGVYVYADHIPSKSKALKVIYATDRQVVLMERNDKVISNYILLSEDNPIFDSIKTTVVL